MLIGICVVRNEADILGQVLSKAAPAHDLILVTDNASTDGTRDIMADVSRDHPHVVDIGSSPEPVWAERVRRHVWARFRSAVPAGTWWSFIDGDEFADEPLRAVVGEAEDEGADHVQAAFATFVYKRSEAEAWREGRESLSDRGRPIEERRRFYRVTAYSVRLFREHAALRWNADTYTPDGLIRCMKRRICYRHYQHRDLDQLELRLRSRQGVDAPDWHRRMHYHWHYSVEEALHPDDDPDLEEYVPGEPIPLPEAWRRPWVKDPLRRAAARVGRGWAALAPQQPPAMFTEIDVAEVMSRAWSP